MPGASQMAGPRVQPCRGFATLNAPNMTRETLQARMRHQSPLTTARYINYVKEVNPAGQALHVPDVLKTASVG